MAQLGGEQKLLTRCHHEAVGPPLKSFLFDYDSDAFASPAACYAHHVCEALAFLRRTYRHLPLHERLALLGPTAEFVAALRPELLTCAANRFPSWKIAFVSATGARLPLACPLTGEPRRQTLRQVDLRIALSSHALPPPSCARSDLAGWPHPSPSSVHTEASALVGSSLDSGGLPSDGIERIVLDTIEQFDGLERLIVIGVGLDSPIADEGAYGAEDGNVGGHGDVDPCAGVSEGTVAASMDGATAASAAGAECGAATAGSTVGQRGSDRQTRSMLYRAVTRAHMQVIVVNELLSGGWLEFLGSVRLREDEHFDAERALERCEASAVESIVSDGIEERLSSGAREAMVPLDAKAISLLRDEAARAVEGGIALEDAVRGTLRGWCSDFVQVRRSVERAAAHLGLSLCTNAEHAADSSGTAQSDCDGRAVTAGDEHGAGVSAGNASLLQELTLSVAVALRRGEAIHLDVAAESAVKIQLEREYHARIDAALLAVTTVPTLAIDLPRAEVPSLRAWVDAAVQQRGESLESAAHAAVAKWREVDNELREAFAAEATTWCGTLSTTPSASCDANLRHCSAPAGCQDLATTTCPLVTSSPLATTSYTRHCLCPLHASHRGTLRFPHSHTGGWRCLRRRPTNSLTTCAASGGAGRQ